MFLHRLHHLEVNTVIARSGLDIDLNFGLVYGVHHV